jgi:hypothetical protein
MNDYGKPRRMTDRNPAIVTFHLYLAAIFVTIRQLIQRARTRYRWDPRHRHQTAQAITDCRAL